MINTKPPTTPPITAVIEEKFDSSLAGVCVTGIVATKVRVTEIVATGLRLTEIVETGVRRADIDTTGVDAT
jgi:hypothetical protein